MSVQEGRGGYPHVFQETVGTAGRHHRFPFTTKYLKIRVATNPCLMYFTQDDYDNGTNVVTVPVPAAETPHGEWEGPVEASQIWLKGSGGNTAVELVAFQRRG